MEIEFLVLAPLPRAHSTPILEKCEKVSAGTAPESRALSRSPLPGKVDLQSAAEANVISAFMIGVWTSDRLPDLSPGRQIHREHLP